MDPSLLVELLFCRSFICSLRISLIFGPSSKPFQYHRRNVSASAQRRRSAVPTSFCFKTTGITQNNSNVERVIVLHRVHARSSFVRPCCLECLRRTHFSLILLPFKGGLLWLCNNYHGLNPLHCHCNSRRNHTVK